jgi:hypothetical protein
MAEANSESKTARIREIVDECLVRPPDEATVAQLLAAHADLMPELRLELRKVAMIQGVARRFDEDSKHLQEKASELETLVRSGASASGAEDLIPGYYVLREISRGGQAVVYQAVQQSTGRKVAIKILREGVFASASEMARFQREAQVLAALDHPNIVSVLDCGTTSTGSLFLVMQYVSGRSLDEFLEGPPPRQSRPG